MLTLFSSLKQGENLAGEGEGGYENFLINIPCIFLNFIQHLRINSERFGQFLATDPEVPGSIPGASRFSEKQRVWNEVH
jgi:hypothetical protein